MVGRSTGESVLSRYERDPNGRLIVDVDADRIEDLYSDFDRRAPYIRRDLEPELVDYITGSVREVGPADVIIRFNLGELPTAEALSRIEKSVHRYFLYLAEVERNEVGKMLRRSAVLLALGLVILSLSVWLNQHLGEQRGVVENVFAEGLTVAAWVSLWEALAVFLLDWFPRRGNIVLFEKIATAPIAFAGQRQPSFIATNSK